MELNPWVFVILAYGVAAVIAACVALIVKIIAYLVQRKKGEADEGTGQEAGDG
jgi:hypothetical protein